MWFVHETVYQIAKIWLNSATVEEWNITLLMEIVDTNSWANWFLDQVCKIREKTRLEKFLLIQTSKFIEIISQNFKKKGNSERLLKAFFIS